MTNERWLRWAIARHFRQKGFKVNMKPVKVGNAAIDGEVQGVGRKMALEIKSGHDDIVRGLGQIAEAKAFGYDSAALVTSLRTAKHVDAVIFDKLVRSHFEAEEKRIFPWTLQTHRAIRKNHPNPSV